MCFDETRLIRCQKRFRAFLALLLCLGAALAAWISIVFCFQRRETMVLWIAFGSVVAALLIIAMLFIGTMKLRKYNALIRFIKKGNGHPKEEIIGIVDEVGSEIWTYRGMALHAIAVRTGGEKKATLYVEDASLHSAGATYAFNVYDNVVFSYEERSDEKA